MLNNLQIVLPIITLQAPISDFMTYGGSQFIKMIQKNKKKDMYFFTCVEWGQDKPAWTAWPLGVKITRVGGGRYLGISSPRVQAVLGGKINCYTGDRNISQQNESRPVSDIDSYIIEKKSQRTRILLS